MSEKPSYDSVPDAVLTECLARLSQEQRPEPQDERGESAARDYARLVNNLLLTFHRHRAIVDWTIGRLTGGRRTREALLNVLRIGLTEIFYMSGLPPALVTDTCVRWVGRRHSRRESGFINAVLRRAIRETPEALLSAARERGPEYVQLELSPELTHQWQYMSKAARADLARQLLGPAPLTVRARTEVFPELVPDEAMLTPLPPPDWMPTASLWTCRDAAAFFASAGFKQGHYYVQDASTLLAPALLAPGKDELVADLCAAPGGKSIMFSDLARQQAKVVACDVSWARLQRVRQNARCQADILLLNADAMAPPFQPAKFDALLLDVPCSNTGVIKRRPDVRWRFTRQRLKDLVELQRRMLAAAIPLVKPGGRLIYSTCSLEPEENHAQIEWFLATYPQFGLRHQQQLMPTDAHDGAYAAAIVAR